jgi:hypothetical protein
MSHVELLIPFSIPPAALAQDLMRQLKAPHLAQLLKRTRAAITQNFEVFSQNLPHEIYITGQISVAKHKNSASSLNQPKPQLDRVGTYNEMQKYGLLPTSGFWFTLYPVHFHVANDHLVLIDQRRTDISPNESLSLFETAAALCQEAGKTLVFGDAKTWFLRADDWASLETVSKDMACGRNIDIWMAKGVPASAWRRLQNEIQMAWFAHKVNQDREDSRQLTVNSVWLEAGSRELITCPNWTVVEAGTFFFPQQLPDASAKQDDKTPMQLVCDALIEPSINSDWGQWLERMQSLDQTLFKELHGAVLNGLVTSFQLTASDATQIACFVADPLHRWKFWRKPDMTPLFSLVTP